MDIILWIIGALLLIFACLICYAALCIASDADDCAERERADFMARRKEKQK